MGFSCFCHLTNNSVQNWHNRKLNLLGGWKQTLTAMTLMLSFARDFPDKDDCSLDPISLSRSTCRLTSTLPYLVLSNLKRMTLLTKLIWSEQGHHLNGDQAARRSHKLRSLIWGFGESGTTVYGITSNPVDVYCPTSHLACTESVSSSLPCILV